MSLLSKPLTYQPVETPLSEELDEEIYYAEYYDEPVGDPIWMRMFIILVVVILSVGAFATFVVPRLLLSSQPEETIPVAVVVPPQPALPLVEENQEGTSENLISPLFAPEIQYWADEIVKWSDLYGINDPDAVATVMQIESCGNPNAISSANAQGLFQVMPYHFVAGENMTDPETNARRGMGYLAEQIKRFNNIYLAFAAYNGGPGNAVQEQSKWPKETQRYYYWSQGIYEDAKAGLTESPRLQEWLNAGGRHLCGQAASYQAKLR